MKAIMKAGLLDELETQVEHHLLQVTHTFQNLDTATLLEAAPGGGWSMAQCLEHLNSYGRYYLPAIEQALGNAACGAVAGSLFKSTWLGDYFTRMMQPGEQIKHYKAPKDHTPQAALDAHAVIAVFIEQQEQLLALIRKARMADINAIRIPISISRWIRLKLGDVFRFLVAHNGRHLMQAGRLLVTPPGSH